MIALIEIQRKGQEYTYSLSRDNEKVRDGEPITRERAMEIVRANNGRGKTEDGAPPSFRLADAAWRWWVVIQNNIHDTAVPVSPVSLFMELGGFGWSPSTTTATFTSREAADRFKAAYPTWTVWVHEGVA